MSSKEFKVAAICSFSDDEPLNELLDAAAAFPDVWFYITGDMSRAAKRILSKKQSNIIFTGFLEQNKYESVLREVDAIIVLTTRDKTMLSGAYDALALQKPLITSNWGPLKRFFSKGTICVDNSVEQIQSAIKIVQEKKEELEQELYQLKLEKTKEWEEKFSSFKRLLLQDYIGRSKVANISVR